MLFSANSHIDSCQWTLSSQDSSGVRSSAESSCSAMLARSSSSRFSSSCACLSAAIRFSAASADARVPTRVCGGSSSSSARYEAAAATA
eukprot:3187392-Prymnesium_polylepis.1